MPQKNEKVRNSFSKFQRFFSDFIISARNLISIYKQKNNENSIFLMKYVELFFLYGTINSLH
jgi:hypothetical protein